jgi:hypothetical protein
MLLRRRFVVRMRNLGLAGLILCLRVSAVAQQTVPTITFTFDFPGSAPSHYVTSISADGHASYVSNGKLGNDSEPTTNDSWRREFIVSPSNSTRVFDLAKRAHYFEGEIDSKKKGIASTGSKTLTYKDAQKNSQANYNYSPVPAVQDLTAFFQRLSTTLEFGQRLDFYLRYQKLALDEELKGMEGMWNNHELEEVPAVAPVLQKIADDASVIKVVRARAQRLLQLAESGSK